MFESKSVCSAGGFEPEAVDQPSDPDVHCLSDHADSRWILEICSSTCHNSIKTADSYFSHALYEVSGAAQQSHGPTIMALWKSSVALLK